MVANGDGHFFGMLCLCVVKAVGWKEVAVGGQTRWYLFWNAVFVGDDGGSGLEGGGGEEDWRTYPICVPIYVVSENHSLQSFWKSYFNGMKNDWF